MRRLTKNLKKYYYIEPLTVKIGKMDVYKAEFMVWYANFVTIPLFGRRYTVIIGLNYELFKDFDAASKFMDTQKMLYKLALIKSKK